MFRALLWKEWRQLRGLRWAGVALGAILPVAFIAGAEASRHGVTLFGGARDYSVTLLFGEALWATLALGLWPLVALMTTAQAYAGDHAAGTETFLLERPVPRGRIWLTRLAACVGSVVVVAVLTSAIALTLELTSGAAPPRSLGVVLAAGAGVTALALLGGITAASLVRAPIAAVLLGGALGAIPPVLSGLLVAAFPFASWRYVHLGAVLPWLLVPAYVAASVRGLCAGEPLGGGRLRRMLLVIVPSVLVCVLLFVTLAPAVVRLEARDTWSFGVAPSPAGSSAFVGGMGWSWRLVGGWIVDTRDASKRRFLPPSVGSVAWKPDGSQVVIGTDSGSLGGVRDEGRLEFYDATGRECRMPIPLGDAHLWDLVWAGDRLVAKRRLARKVDLVVIEPGTGTTRPTGFSMDGFTFDAPVTVVDPATAYLAVVPRAVPDAGEANADDPRYPLGPIPILLYRIDVAAARVDSEPVIHDQGHPELAAFKLSRDGRYWVLNKRDGDRFRRVIVEVSTGQEFSQPQVTASERWIGRDRLAWIEKRGARARLVTARVGGPGRAVREWDNAVVALDPSPDGNLLLVRAAMPRRTAPMLPMRREPEDDPGTFTTGELPISPSPAIGIYDPENDAWIEPAVWASPAWGEYLPPKPDNPAVASWWWATTTWAGPRTLARQARGTLAFEDLDRPGELRFVLGSPSPELRAAAR